jgi:hypothetical protein
MITAKLYDLATNELADISSIALEKTLKRRLNLSRGFTIQAPAGHSLLTSIAGDGYPNLRKGNRKLIVWDDGDGPGDQPIFHGRIFGVERNGNGTQNLATITGFDPYMELGFDSDDRAGRPVRDSTGNFINPTFVSSVDAGAAVSGPDLIQQVLTNSQQVGDESDPSPGEGPLPIDLVTGDFDVDVPPAIDLSVVDTMDWPVLIGDFIAQLVQTGVVDWDMRPVDPSEGFDPYVMVALSAVSSLGTDRSATVHFDYWTGSKNASACRHVEDFATINNKLYDYLGPRLDNQHWRANITPGSPGTIVDPTASRALYGGQFMSIRVLDSIGTEASSRPLYIALWNAEQGYRIEPRNMLFITPNPGGKALFLPPADFDVGDLVAVNTGADFGVALAETQRVYGYDKTWDRQGVARISELITSADAE